MKRRNAAPAVPAIPPFIDRFGRPTYENPFGHNRPNPALTAPAQPAPVVQPIVLNPTPVVAAAAAPVAQPVASIASDAPAVAEENAAAALTEASRRRLHLTSHTTA